MSATTNSNGKIPAFEDLTPEQRAKLDSFVDPDAQDTAHFGWDDAFQRNILGALLTDPEVYRQVNGLLKPGYFSNEWHVLIAKETAKYYQEYGALPELVILKQAVRDATKDRDDKIILDAVSEAEAVYTYFVPGLTTRKCLVDKVKKFCTKQQIRTAFHKCNKFLEEDPEHPEKAAAVIAAGMHEVLARTATGPGLTSCADLMTRPDGEWLVEDHFPRDSVCMVYGKYGSLKSFLAIEAALCVATGLPFLGKFPVVAGPVVYIAAEGEGGLKKRVRAWMKARNIAVPPVNLHLVFNRFDLAVAGEAQKVLALIREVKPVLVIFDTFARNVKSEEPKDVAAATVELDAIRRGLDRPAVAVIHHAGKDESRGSRGSSVLPGACDTIFEVKKLEDVVKVRCEKQKDYEEVDDYTLGWQVVDLGQDARGEPLNSLVLTVGQTLAQAVAEKEERDEAEDVLAVLPDNERDALSRTEIGIKLGWDGRDHVRRVMERLEKSIGKVVLLWVETKTKKGPPERRYWRVSVERPVERT